MADRQAREAAVARTDSACPRCGTPRRPGQEYCLECGLRLPRVTGTLAQLRRSWIRRIGWYPGDWIWPALLTLPIAVAGAAVSIAFASGGGNGGTTFVSPPTSASKTTTTTTTTSPLPVPPEPT